MNAVTVCFVSATVAIVPGSGLTMTPTQSSTASTTNCDGASVSGGMPLSVTPTVSAAVL